MSARDLAVLTKEECVTAPQSSYVAEIECRTTEDVIERDDDSGMDSLDSLVYDIGNGREKY